jgi:two-component system NarL family sensor kinase
MQAFDQGILIIIVSSIFVLLLIVAFLLFINSYTKRNMAYKLERLQLESHFEQALLRSQLEIREQTLTNIASELHDNLGQVASLIKINLNTLQLDDKARSETKIADTKDLVRQLINDLKSLSVSLNSDRVTHLGLMASLENEMERLNKTGYLEASLHVDTAMPALDPNATIILYRMLQEIINNILKHSSARHVQINIRSAGSSMTIECIDDGIGFNKEERLKSGSGLTNLQNRAKLINAQFQIHTAPGKGTRVTIDIPL